MSNVVVNVIEIIFNVYCGISYKFLHHMTWKFYIMASLPPHLMDNVDISGCIFMLNCTCLSCFFVYALYMWKSLYSPHSTFKWMAQVNWITCTFFKCQLSQTRGHHATSLSTSTDFNTIFYQRFYYVEKFIISKFILTLPGVLLQLYR